LFLWGHGPTKQTQKNTQCKKKPNKGFPLFLWRERGKGGGNNNPTSRAFVAFFWGVYFDFSLGGRMIVTMMLYIRERSINKSF